MLEHEEKQGYVLQLIPIALELCLLVGQCMFYVHAKYTI